MRHALSKSSPQGLPRRPRPVTEQGRRHLARGFTLDEIHVMGARYGPPAFSPTSGGYTALTDDKLSFSLTPAIELEARRENWMELQEAVTANRAPVVRHE